MTKVINHRLLEVKSEEAIYAYLDELEAYFLAQGTKERETEMVDCSPACNRILSQEIRTYDVTDLTLATFYTKMVALRAYLEKQSGIASKAKPKNWIEVLNFPSAKQG